MSAERNNVEVRELRNLGGPSRSFRLIRKDRVPVAKWALKGKKSEQGSNHPTTFLFLISSLIGLLQVTDLFKTHPAKMWIAVAALVIFCLSLSTSKKKITHTDWATYSPIVDWFRDLSGALVPVSLSSIFLPDRFWWLFSVIWVLLAFIVTRRHFYKFIYTRIYPGVRKAFQSLCNSTSNTILERSHHSARCFA
ncbi:hypothetical protein FH972_010992 [Carpinus fangiana]|uniref:Uncharacterized protein n=1 Tax=Carpinus fangiana TaxID=176857 RepID=A0A660KSX6_9ROSI|nr:hypothetical protein FH972_010992 [Carpinus fangiana]